MDPDRSIAVAPGPGAPLRPRWWRSPAGGNRRPGGEEAVLGRNAVVEEDPGPSRAARARTAHAVPLPTAVARGGRRGAPRGASSPVLGHRGSGDGNGWVGWDIDKIPARWENVILKVGNPGPVAGPAAAGHWSSSHLRSSHLNRSSECVPSGDHNGQGPQRLRACRCAFGEPSLTAMQLGCEPHHESEEDG